ncbi:Zinc finger, RING/FYVE/PHD-type [Artemisia annua]|uniref:Zinc finger, RING/FYVE/PHD-type n=1 Tax=Artemisia annua TaxID=35608 RepID=A0A2U1LEK1_ARTAN|nr:Zinc finger, RING/FYVE/PHD-type [Artemisia annua]
MDFFTYHPSRLSNSQISFGNLALKVKDFFSSAASTILGNLFSAIFTFFFATVWFFYMGFWLFQLGFFCFLLEESNARMEATLSQLLTLFQNKFGEACPSTRPSTSDLVVPVTSSTRVAPVQIQRPTEILTYVQRSDATSTVGTSGSDTQSIVRDDKAAPLASDPSTDH